MPHYDKRLATALVDYDNVCSFIAPERSPADVAGNLTEFLPKLAGQARTVLHSLEDLNVRFYGGWRDVAGRNTPRADWLLASLPRFRTRFHGVRVRPSLATELIVRPSEPLVATYKDGAQKMVDVMLSVDAVALALAREASVVLVSDDEDFVPGTVVSGHYAERATHILLLRRARPIGSSPNDALIQSLGVIIARC